MSDGFWGFDWQPVWGNSRQLHRWGKVSNPERYATADHFMRANGLRSPSWWERLRGIR